MRHFLFHPVLFYPLVALVAAGVIALSLRPQSWPRAPAAQASVIEDGAIVLEGAALGAPAGEPAQVIYAPRDIIGRAEALRIAVLPNQPAPGPGERGVRVLLAPEAGARLSGRAVAVEVSVRPLQITTAARLAVSLQGAGPARWATQALAPQEQALRFELPAAEAVTAVGLRAVSDYADYNYGVEIVRIRIVPADAAAPGD